MSNCPAFVIVVRDDELARYKHEFSLLCDRLDVCEEIRDGYYSDEALLGDLFSFLDPPKHVAARVASLDLPGVTRATDLLDVLMLIRKLWAVH